MATFWDWRTPSGANVATPPALQAAETTLEPVEVYTPTAMIHGMVEPEGRRLSDILNSNSVLAIRNARSTSLLSDVDGSDTSGWSRLPTDEILFVMPPKHESARQLRVHRRQHRVRIRTGQFRIVGNAHVLPGIRLDHPYVLRSRMHFLAITDAHVSSLGDPAWERSAPVVLVNIRPVEDLKEVVTIS
jgi:hypothetical protein